MSKNIEKFGEFIINNITQYESSLIDNVEALVKQIVGIIKNPNCNEAEKIFRELLIPLVKSTSLLEKLNELHVLCKTYEKHKYALCISHRTTNKVKKDKKSKLLMDCSTIMLLDAIVNKLDFCCVKIFNNEKRLVEPKKYIPENVTYCVNGYDITDNELIEFAKSLKTLVLYFSPSFLISFKQEYESIKKEHKLRIINNKMINKIVCKPVNNKLLIRELVSMDDININQEFIKINPNNVDNLSQNKNNHKDTKGNYSLFY